MTETCSGCGRVRPGSLGHSICAAGGFCSWRKVEIASPQIERLHTEACCEARASRAAAAALNAGANGIYTRLCSVDCERRHQEMMQACAMLRETAGPGYQPRQPTVIDSLGTAIAAIAKREAIPHDE